MIEGERCGCACVVVGERQGPIFPASLPIMDLFLELKRVFKSKGKRLFYPDWEMAYKDLNIAASSARG